jgi:nitrate reductase gamma subunit
MRFFVEPVPGFVEFIAGIDSIFQIGVPLLQLTDLIILAALTYLFVRRVVIPQVRYISLPTDYFALLLLLSIVITGILMRYFTKVDLVGVKELAMGLISLSPVVPEGIGTMFYVHLGLVCALLIYFPFSKLMHMGGVFLSPTRNLANNNRERRHINPWNYPVKVHTYEEYEEEFHDKMKAAGMPLEKP